MHRFDTEQVARDVSSGVDATEEKDGLSLPDDAGTPERSLMLATLKDGIYKLRKGFRKPKSVRPVEWRELQDWFASDDTGHPFTFMTICDTLSIDHLRLRRLLTRYKDDIEGSRALERMAEFEAWREQRA